MQKLFCYVDESGQDTKGDLFLVSVIIAEGDRKGLRDDLERVEKKTGKGKRKWIRSRKTQRADYIRAVLRIPELKGRIYFARYRGRTEYLSTTVLTTARAITKHAEENYKAVVFVDGLPKSQTQWFGTELRHLRIRTQKVRGVRKEESDALMRLADAVAGFVRAAFAGHEEMGRLLKSGKRRGYINEI